MRLIVSLFLLALLCTSCSTEKNLVSQKINVTLIDENTDNFVEGGAVTLTSIIGDIDIEQEVKYTDGNGQCSFLFNYNPSNHYRMHAQKEGLLIYLVNDTTGAYLSNTDIDATTPEDLTLYLTSNSLNHFNYWKEVTPHYTMEELINLLRTDQYTEGIPWLEWEDIPALLAVGNDSAIINNFPKNPISSYLLDECYTGIIALWFVESIRITARDQLVSPFEKYPSLNPILKYKDPSETTPENSIEKMNDAFQAYQQWWNEVQNMEPSAACQIDPLENENLTWH